MSFPKVWDIISLFKERCRFLGWETSKIDDWVMCGGKYHSFVWIRDVHPSTFVRLASKKRCIVQEGVFYRVVDAAYTAWVFPQDPPKGIIGTVVEDPQLSRRIALYDLSWVYRGKPLCLKVNKTDSVVFREFEKFLKKEVGIQIKLMEEETSEATEETVLAK